MALFKKKTESAEIEEISLEDLSLDYNENDQEDEEVKQDDLPSWICLSFHPPTGQ